MKSDPIQSELLKSSTNPIRTRSGRIGFGFGSDSHTFNPGNLQFKITNDDQQRLVPIHLLHFAHRSHNC